MVQRARKLTGALTAIALAAAAAFAIACGLTDNDGGGPVGAATATPAATQTATTPPEEALRRYVNRLGQGFVPNCDDAERPQDVGKQCARLLGEREGLLAYALGPTFSGPTRILILAPEAGDWKLVRSEIVDPNLPAVPGIPWPLEVGATVVVAGTAPDCLKVRQGPGLGSAEIGCLEDGTEVTIVAGPAEADELEWWQLEGHGWAAGSYLRYPEEPPAPTETPEQ